MRIEEKWRDHQNTFVPVRDGGVGGHVRAGRALALNRRVGGGGGGGAVGAADGRVGVVLVEKSSFGITDQQQNESKSILAAEITAAHADDDGGGADDADTACQAMWGPQLHSPRQSEISPVNLPHSRHQFSEWPN